MSSGYIKKTLENIIDEKCEKDNTFYQAITEVLESIKPLLDSDKRYEENAVLERIVVPDRIIQFKVEWLDDDNQIRVNNGYRIQFNNVLGPYKGGLRFHPSVNDGILKFLAFEQIFKNSLTGLPIGGAKGGSDFNPKGKSDMEIMKFCTAFMSELHKYIGSRVDIPAGDIGVGSREIGYLFGTYKKITSTYEGVISGKPFYFGGSLLRPEATGYGVVYFTEELLNMLNKDELTGKPCLVSGAGNVAIHTIEKLLQIGAVPITCSDSRGTIYDKRGIDIKLLKEIKLNKRGSLEEYVKINQDAIYVKKEDYPKGAHEIWTIPAYAAFPCATQNELNEIDAKNLVENGIEVVIEGANMPCTPNAIEIFKQNGIVFGPAKAANAGGVAVSEFEMSQNAALQKWGFEKVDAKLQDIMKQIVKRVVLTAKDYDLDNDFIAGANIAGFKKVADAMILEGI